MWSRANHMRTTCETNVVSNKHDKSTCDPHVDHMLLQGRRKMKKVRGALRPLKAQVLLGGPGTRPPEIFSSFSTLKHVFLHF